MLHGKIDLNIDVNTEEGYHMLEILLYQTELLDEDNNEELLYNIARSIDPNSIWGLRSLNGNFNLDLDLNKFRKDANGKPIRRLEIIDYFAGLIDVKSKDIFDDMEYFTVFLRSGLLADQQVAVEFISHFESCDPKKFVEFAEFVNVSSRNSDSYSRGYKKVADYICLLSRAVDINPLIDQIIGLYTCVDDWRNYNEWNFIEMLTFLKDKAKFEITANQKTKLAEAAMKSSSGSNAVLLMTSGFFDIDSSEYNELHIFIYEMALPALSEDIHDEHIDWLTAADSHSARLVEHTPTSLNADFGM